MELDFLKARWENLIMMNYAVDPQVLLPYLPKGVELDFYQGQTYVSLVGFLFKKTQVFGCPIPFYGTFEEVNLRFYVTRKEGDEVKRGVVFINETVPNLIVAWVANKLYKEHYTALPTRHNWSDTEQNKQIEYEWKVEQVWNQMQVTACLPSKPMATGSAEEFIFEHYYGYTKVDADTSIEYKVNHPSWNIHEVLSYEIDCDFESMYGADFAFLRHLTPNSVMLAVGSEVSVKWKRKVF